MTTLYRSAKALLLALPLVCTLAGCCCQAIPCLPDERHCPTDARRLYWTFGEEAVRRCPCGPDREFYGLKPTEWRSWPEGWRCNESQWGEPIFAEPESEYADSSDAEPAANERALGEMVPNPFRRVAERQRAESDDSSRAKSTNKPPASEASPPADPGGKTADAAAEAPPVTPTAPAVAVIETPKFEPAPLIKFPIMYTALAEIQAAAPVTAKTEPPVAGKKPDASSPAKDDLDATPARGVPHVDQSLSNRVQQHLLDNLTL